MERLDSRINRARKNVKKTSVSALIDEYVESADSDLRGYARAAGVYISLFVLGCLAITFTFVLIGWAVEMAGGTVTLGLIALAIVFTMLFVND